jgi:uncharacterized OsmC-like protein
MAEERGFTVTMEQLDEFEFRVKFGMDGVDDLVMDEPEPVGHDRGPNASRVLAAALGNCLTASLLFCLRKSRVETTGMKTTVTGTMTRNEKGRMRIGGLHARLTVEGLGENAPKAQRCLGLFEDFCVVTASVRNGVPIEVEVVDEHGNRLA